MLTISEHIKLRDDIHALYDQMRAILKTVEAEFPSSSNAVITARRAMRVVGEIRQDVAMDSGAFEIYFPL
jgi:hypothetical protein